MHLAPGLGVKLMSTRISKTGIGGVLAIVNCRRTIPRIDLGDMDGRVPPRLEMPRLLIDDSADGQVQVVAGCVLLKDRADLFRRRQQGTISRGKEA